MSLKIDLWCKTAGINVSGHLPFDPQMVEAMVQGLSIIEFDSGSDISKMLKEIWNKILKINQI